MTIPGPENPLNPSSKSGAASVAFVINPSLWYNSMYPVGILCLSSYLTACGIPNAILDSGLSRRRVPYPRREGLILEAVAALKPRIVCFSSTHREFDEVVRLNEAVAAVDRTVTTIVGGSQPTYRPSDFLDNGFRYLCVGEGEKTLREFAVEVLSGAPKWERVQGLAWKSGDETIRNEKRELLTEEEMGTSLLPAYLKLDRRAFDFNVGIIRGLPLRGALLLTTRGCPFSCTFCGCNAIFGKKLRRRPLDSIEDELAFLRGRFGTEGLWIVDDTFTVNKKHALEVAALLQRSGFLWGCQSRVDTIDEELMRTFADSGCVQIDFGVESGSPRVLDDIIRKGTKVPQILEAFALARKYRVRTLANIMIGLPTETRSDLGRTLDIVRKIKADTYVFSIATPLPGTPLYDMVGEDIGPHQYSLLDWNGSPLTDRLNKSDIPNIVRMRNRLSRKYLLRSIVKSPFSLRTLKTILGRPHVLGRVWSVFRFLGTERTLSFWRKRGRNLRLEPPGQVPGGKAAAARSRP